MPGGGSVRAPLSWLADHAELSGRSPLEVADALVRVGLEVERVETAGDAISGPLMVGRALTVSPEPQKNGKTINWCTVDVGEPEPRGIVCGAHNFQAGDLVVVALPGAVLPGGFAIAARKTYGHVSDGMICSARELGIGEDHAGIIVLAAGAPGDDARTALGVDDAVLTIAVTPDRGYCLSIRGLAREAATALGVAFRDVVATVPDVDGDAHGLHVDAPDGCDQFSLRAVGGLDPSAPSPEYLRRRLRQAGMRPISLAVDVTNYVMLETGQPLHAFDRGTLTGAVGVRRARAGETLTTLDGTTRRLDEDDLLVVDDAGALALAGVMGGQSSEIGPSTTDVLLEAAHWTPNSIARTVRRHRLPSEAAKRFERGVDPQIAAVALQRCVDLLVEHGGAKAAPGFTVVGRAAAPAPISLDSGHPTRLTGLEISRAQSVTALGQVGCTVTGEDVLTVIPPSWRPDLTMAADLIEEIVRLVGYDRVPSALPTPPPGRGLTGEQRLRRAVSRALAAAGATEVLTSPFVASSTAETLGLAADDPRRSAARVANPLSDAEPFLRTSLLPGLLATLVRNVGRGQRDLVLYEIGLVFLAAPGRPPVPRPGVSSPPTAEVRAALDAALPDQPRHVGAVLSGEVDRSGWWGPGRTAGWSDAVELARLVVEAARGTVEIRAGSMPPWHPGRCAEIVVDGRVIGHAGELHPRVVAALDLPARTCAMELTLDPIAPPPPAVTPAISSFPPVLLDVALIVDSAVPAQTVEQALRVGAGPLLESVRLFDVYTGLGDGVRSLAFALRLRAPERTLTVEEATAIRDAAVARAAEATGARLRG